MINWVLGRMKKQVDKLENLIKSTDKEIVSLEQKRNGYQDDLIALENLAHTISESI